MDIPVIFEDNSLLVIDKPSGIVVNRAETNKERTVQDWRESKFPISLPRRPADNFPFPKETEREFVSRSGIVHRLDKDTSGLLVIARTPEAFENLKKQFKGREVTKKYLALVHGIVEPSSGTIKAPIERNPFNRKHFGIFPGGREAETAYKTISNFKFLISKEVLPLTYLEVSPKTGRTHQIRVHMKYINHPVVSDPIYGGRKQIKNDLSFCPRLFLHATYLKIKHPVTGEWLEFNSKLPEDLQKVLEMGL